MRKRIVLSLALLFLTACGPSFSPTPPETTTPITLAMAQKVAKTYTNTFLKASATSDPKIILAIENGYLAQQDKAHLLFLNQVVNQVGEPIVYVPHQTSFPYTFTSTFQIEITLSVAGKVNKLKQTILVFFRQDGKDQPVVAFARFSFNNGLASLIPAFDVTPDLYLSQAPPTNLAIAPDQLDEQWLRYNTSRSPSSAFYPFLPSMQNMLDNYYFGATKVVVVGNYSPESEFKGSKYPTINSGYLFLRGFSGTYTITGDCFSSVSGAHPGIPGGKYKKVTQKIVYVTLFDDASNTLRPTASPSATPLNNKPKEVSLQDAKVKVWSIPVYQDAHIDTPC